MKENRSSRQNGLRRLHQFMPHRRKKWENIGYGYQVWMEERPGSFAFNGMLGQNVLGYPDTGVVIVTNAGSNELFQTCEMLDIVRKYFGAEFGAELKCRRGGKPDGVSEAGADLP